MRQRMLKTLQITGVLAILTLGSSAAASTFEVAVDDRTELLVGCGSLGPSPASGTWENNTGNSTGSSSSSAFSTANGLGGSASATSIGTQQSFNRNQACFRGLYEIDDVIFSGPASEVVVQVSAIANGWITTSGTGAGDGFASWYVSMKIREFTGTQTNTHDSQAFTEGFGAPNDMAVGITLTSDLVTLPTGVPIIIELQLSAVAVATDIWVGDTASALADFPNGLSLPTSGPVFILPPGFTANSVDGHIVDNRLDPPAVPALSRPAVSMLALLLAAFGGRGLIRTKRLG